MAATPRITFRNMAPSGAVTTLIEKHAARLFTRDPRIVDCHVTVEAPHQHKGGLYRVAIRADIPGAVIAIAHEGPQDPRHTDVHVAIGDAFAAAERQLDARLERTEGHAGGHRERRGT